MAQAFSDRPLNAEARVQSQVSPCEICGEQKGRTGFSPSTSVLSWQHLSAGAPCRLIHVLMWLCNLNNWFILLSLESLVDLNLFQNCRPVSNFRSFSTEHFLWGGGLSPTPNPQPVGPGYSCSSGTSPLTCVACETLSVATLPQAYLSGSFDHASPANASK
jgi:hypothetical protein